MITEKILNMLPNEGNEGIKALLGDVSGLVASTPGTRYLIIKAGEIMSAEVIGVDPNDNQNSIIEIAANLDLNIDFLVDLEDLEFHQHPNFEGQNTNKGKLGFYLDTFDTETGAMSIIVTAHESNLESELEKYRRGDLLLGWFFNFPLTQNLDIIIDRGLTTPPIFALHEARFNNNRAPIDDLLAETPDRYRKIKDKVEEMILDPEMEIQLKDVVNYLPWEFNYFKYRSFGFRK